MDKKDLNSIESRRSFIEKVAKGTALTTVGLSGFNGIASPLSSEKNEFVSKPIIIGIIGAENSHTAAFGKLFNIDKEFPGVEVKYVWGETESFAKTAMEKGSIPNQVLHPSDMLGKIDALIVDHRHGKFHLEAATPFIKAGIPTFIDKPFCYRKDEGERFLTLARQLKTPVTSYSSIAHSYDTIDIRDQIDQLGKIQHLVRYGPVDMESKYGGVFFYGPHLIEPLLYFFDTNVKKVRVNKTNKNGSATLIFEDGMMVTLIFTTQHYGWQTFVETEDGVIELKSRVEDKIPAKSDVDMVTMFKTGKEPRKHTNILHGVAIMEALEKSGINGQWEDVTS